MSEKKDEHVPAYLPDVLVAIELLHTGGAHHRYYDEVCNAVAEIERLRVLDAENERLRAENERLNQTEATIEARDEYGNVSIIIFDGRAFVHGLMLDRMHAENAQLRSSLDAMVTHVSQEELARAVDAAKKSIDSSEQGGGI